MPQFKYIIKDSKGSNIENVMTANSIDDAIEKLMKEGGTIISIKNATDTSAKGNISLLDKIILTIYKWKNSVSLKTLVFFTRQLSTMFSAGLTLEKSITDLEKEEKNKKFKAILKKISNDIKKGFSLSEAMEQHHGVFDPLYLALVKAGEVSGTLHTILDELSDYLEKVEDTRRKVSSALTYPIFIIIFLILVVWLMFYWLIPQFEETYSQFGADLPLATQTAMFISQVIKDNLFISLFIFTVFITTMFIVNLTDKGKYFFDYLKIKIPVIGSLVSQSIMSKFARTFSILMGAGVPIMETLELTENVVQNAVIENAVKKSRTMVKEGYSIAGALRKTGVFPSQILQLTATGEETGEMEKLLKKAAEFYEKIVNSMIDRLTTLIEPLLIILMAGVVGTIIIVIYLPIFNLGTAIGSKF
jgi:type II secretory pathway component PulF